MAYDWVDISYSRHLIRVNPPLSFDINFVLPHTGVSGGIRVVFELANELEERGHNVRIVVPRIPSAPARHPLNPKKIFRQLSSGLLRWRQSSQVDWFDLSADVVQIPILGAPNAILEHLIPDADITIATAWETAYPVSKLGPSKGALLYFVQHYEIWPLWNHDEYWEKIPDNCDDPGLAMVDINPETAYHRTYKEYVDLSYKLPLGLIITSDWERRVLNRLGESPLGSIKYGVNFDLFSPSVSTPKTEILALYRDKKHKGDPQAIKSFEELHNSHPDLNFLMFGPRYREEIPDFVEFHESPDQENIRDLYSRSDILVYPSWVEGYGMPPMEAMACKTAVVSTDVGAVREYAPQDSISFVPIRDSEEIVKAVSELVARPDEIERRKEAGFNYIQQFTWEKATTNFESMLESAISQ